MSRARSLVGLRNGKSENETKAKKKKTNQISNERIIEILEICHDEMNNSPTVGNHLPIEYDTIDTFIAIIIGVSVRLLLLHQ